MTLSASHGHAGNGVQQPARGCAEAAMLTIPRRATRDGLIRRNHGGGGVTTAAEYAATVPDSTCGCICGCTNLSAESQYILRGTPISSEDPGLCNGCGELWLFLSEKCTCWRERNIYDDSPCTCGAIKHGGQM